MEMMPIGWTHISCTPYPCPYPFDQLDARGQVETEIDEHPHDALLLILFLFEHEHVMIEELLQFLIHEIDPQLFEGVELEDI
jgi:hypothetical protein